MPKTPKTPKTKNTRHRPRYIPVPANPVRIHTWDDAHAKLRRMVAFGFPGPRVCALSIDAAVRLQVAGVQPPRAVVADTTGTVVIGWVDPRTNGDLLRVEVHGRRGEDDGAEIRVLVGPTAHADLERLVCEVLGVPFRPQVGPSVVEVGLVPRVGAA